MLDDFNGPARVNEMFGYSISTLADHTLLGSGFLLDADQRPIIYRGNLTPSPISRKKRRRIFRYRALSRFKRIQMDGVTWVCRPNSDNYSHWLTETLPKLYFLKAIGWSEPIAVSNVLMNMKWVKETIDLFPDQNFIFVPHYTEIRANSIFMVNEHSLDPLSNPNALLLRRMTEFLLASIKTELRDADCKRIHISRQKDNRKVTNIREVRYVLDRFGFKEFYFQDLSLGTQFTLISKAEFVFAPHGAGLANTMFMQEGSKVLEVKHQQKIRQDRVFPALSRALGLSHYVIESARGGGRNDDFFIDPDELAFKLEEMIGEGDLHMPDKLVYRQI